jgi:hypothetical protein
MATESAGEEPHICEVLRRLGKKEWSFSERKNKLYTDLNETWLVDDIVMHIIRNLDEELVPTVDVILKSNSQRSGKVRSVFKAIGGYDIEEFGLAELRAAQQVPLIPEIEHALPYVYPTKIAFFTGLPQTSAMTYVVNKIRPLYYQKVSGRHDGQISVIGTLYHTDGGKITGEVEAIPDDRDRAVLQMADIIAPLDWKEMDAVRKLTHYPISPNGLDYRF